MRSSLNRFLVTSLVVGATAVLASACTVKEVETSTDGGGLAGSGGSAGGSQAGAGGQAQAGAGGQAQGGAGGQAQGGAGGAGGAACLGDSAITDNRPDCSGLPGASETCSGSGTSYTPNGPFYCEYFDQHARRGVFDKFYLCVNDLSIADHCGEAYEDAVQDCVDSTFGQACTVPPFEVDDGAGGTTTVTCADIAATCTASTSASGGFTEAQCTGVMNSMDEVSRNAIYDCYQENRPGNTDCADDFSACAYDIDSYPAP